MPPAASPTFGHRRVRVAGGFFQFAGGVVFVLGVGDGRNLLVWMAGMTLVGLGSALIWPAMFNTLIGVPPHRYGAVTSINQTAQRMATAGGAVLQISLIGEVTQRGAVGNYSRIFVLTVVGGILAMAIGMFMSGLGEH